LEPIGVAEFPKDFMRGDATMKNRRNASHIDGFAARR
jgi:hypothetical protein